MSEEYKILMVYVAGMAYASGLIFGSFILFKLMENFSKELNDNGKHRKHI